MDITVKCPNCYQQVSRDNRYCTFCGYDLSKATSAPAIGDPAPTIPDDPDPVPVPYDGPRYCPKGHDVPDPSLGFCPTCGSPLVNEPAGGYEPTGESHEDTPTEPPVSHKPLGSRKCKKCGYVCEDPDLNFCPACGYPFDDSGFRDEPEWVPGWTCASCGTTNSSDMSFCVSCGKPRGWIPEPDKRDSTHGEISSVPDGMMPPTDDDLKVKAKFGN